jgi:hypothetical protein
MLVSMVFMTNVFTHRAETRRPDFHNGHRAFSRCVLLKDFALTVNFVDVLSQWADQRPNLVLRREHLRLYDAVNAQSLVSAC